jgi:uncharacterized protein
MTKSAAPINLAERADILDVLRGFALVGVLLDNLFAFSGWGFFTQAVRESLPTWPADGILGMLELTFVHGKFYSLFSLLFGIGFAIILLRNEQKGINPLKIFYRRLFILMLIGFAHCLLVWEGDILLLYALIGFLLPLFRKCSDRALLTWAVILIASPILIDGAKILFEFKTGAFLESIAAGVDKRNGMPADDSWRQFLFKEGSGWEEWRAWQASGIYYRYAYIIESNRIPKVLGMFLLGFYVGRKMIYANLEMFRDMLRKLRRWGFIIGIPASLAMAYFEIDEKGIPNPYGLFDTVSYALGVVPLSLAYAASLSLWWLKKKGQTRWKVLAPMGRMALTNYLLQTMIAIFIYYGVGLGLGGNIGPSVFFPLGLAVYALQVLFSHLWLRYFNYGLFEWIWRQLTYGKRLPLRRDRKV